MSAKLVDDRAQLLAECLCVADGWRVELIGASDQIIQISEQLALLFFRG